MYYPLLLKINELIAKMKDKGHKVGLFCGTRSFDEQAKLYAKGRTLPGAIVTNAKPGYSWHAYGLAADVVFIDKGKWSWDKKHPWSLLGKIGEDLGLEWGGRFDFRDFPHFELTNGLDISQARKTYLKTKNVIDVWELVEREGWA